ncbi:hypothetical protein [Pseudomonas sp.]|uniref:hypothetical protein n=1 Tax=Pseudomonas sp. TaxID=306 RepID=UPI0028ABCA42|nr:hypothetical protein [Pseudomonas sp.]
MSEMHDHAIQSIYQQVLGRLQEHLSQAQRASLQLLIQRLLVAAGGLERIGDFRLLLVHGNDRLSAHLLACLRAAQLSIAQRGSQTFSLRVLVLRQPGVNALELARHARCFDALFLHDDSRVELLMADPAGLQPFEAQLGQNEPPHVLERDAWLLFGHVSEGDVDGLVGSRLWLQMARACASALTCEEGVSALVTAVPAAQRRRLLAWSRRCLRLVEPGRAPSLQCASTVIKAMARLQARMAQLPTGLCVLPSRTVRDSGACTLHVLGLDELLQHIGQPDRLNRLLSGAANDSSPKAGFEAWQDPLLAAHLNGLQAQYLRAASYQEGVRAALAHTDLALPCTSRTLRLETEKRLQRGYGLGEEQLACLLFAPFVGRGAQLEAWLRRCHPNMRVALPYVHNALQGRPCPEAVVRWLVGVSGLSLARLQGLYGLRLDDRTLCLPRYLARRDASLRLLSKRKTSE